VWKIGGSNSGRVKLETEKLAPVVSLVRVQRLMPRVRLADSGCQLKMTGWVVYLQHGTLVCWQIKIQLVSLDHLQQI